jgi:metal-responsive CopG/Arc/MetJ family transcriptional regulator
VFGSKIKIDDALYEKLKRAAEEKGYSSTDEFITHLLEAAVADDAGDESEEEVKKRLQGLGYIE